MARALTAAAVHELLDDLIGVFSSVEFQEEVKELRELHVQWGEVRDTRTWEMQQVSARFQYPVLERYGFEASAEGQAEMVAACGLVADAEAAWKLQEVQALASAEQRSARQSPSETAAWKQLAQRYQRDGYVVPLRGLAPFHAAQALAGFRRFREKHVQRLPPCGAYSMNHVWLPWLRDLARHPGITSAVAVALGSTDVFLWDSELVYRSPGQSQMLERGVGWQRDSQHLHRLKPLDRNHFVTAFVALSPCGLRRGCLLALPEGAKQEVPLALLPGQFALIAPSTKRVGGMNHSREPMYGVLLRYVRASTRDLDAAGAGATAALLVLGQNSKGNFLELPDVEGEATDAGLQMRQLMAGRRQPSGAAIPGSGAAN